MVPVYEEEVTGWGNVPIQGKFLDSGDIPQAEVGSGPLFVQ
jgi:hypothetical protein